MSSSVLERIARLDPERYTTLLRVVSEDRHRLVVSFGGGAVPGIVGNIALAYLLEQLDLKQHVEEVWGTSAGAVVAGGWASGSNAMEILGQVKSLDRRGTIDVAWFRLALSFALRPFGRPLPDGIVHGAKFKQAIAAGLKVERLEDCPIPVRLIAVRDDGTLRKKVFRSGPLLPSIFASMSIPGIVVPQEVEPGSGERFYDGGLVEKTPLISPIGEHDRRGDRRKLLLIGTHFDNDVNKSAARGFLARFVQSIYAMEEVSWRYQIAEAHQRSGVTLMLLNPKLTDGSLFDFSSADDNFVHCFNAYADMLQNAKIGLTLAIN